MTEVHSPENGGASAAPENVGTKRHRRPSVRLGEIGGDRISCEHNHQRRPKMLWNKDSSNKGSSKTLTRHCTNFASNETLTLVDNNVSDNVSNGRKRKSDGSNVDAEDRGGNLESVAIGSWKIRDLKSKRSITTKRVRSNLASKVNVNEGDDKILRRNSDDVENNDQIDRDFESDNSEHSPVHSYDNNKSMDKRIGNLDGGWRGTRVSEEGPSDTEHRNWNCSSDRNGVRVWLDQLGLGRYAPLFEIHEVDDEVLPMLTLEDLKDMGISAVGSRRKMYCSIQKLNKGFS